MIYVFEDWEEDLLSKLFMSAYSENSFIYARGAGNLIHIAEKLLYKSDEIILVYLDTIPDNRESIRVYNNLKRLSKKNNFRVIVLPVVCAEYYFIQSLPEDLYYSVKSVNICKSRGFWKNSDLLETVQDREFVRNFEKYCKLILLKNVRHCVKHTRENNNLYGYYYMQNCLCDFSMDICKEDNRLNKAVRYVCEYPVVPELNFKGSFRKLNLDEIWDIQRTLVDTFNDMVDLYICNDCDSAYSKISYIK